MGVPDTIPRPGEFGNDTWGKDSWSYTGNTGVWAQISVDPQLGLAYLPVELPTHDYYGGERPGNNLFSAFWETTASWELAALPLFIWMGEILYRTRLSEQMFDGLSPWLSRVPGRLMHTTVLGCGIFGSVSGSSAATCATIAKVALPELGRRGYNRDLALGWLAAAGGLGILIPVHHHGGVRGGGGCERHPPVPGGLSAGRSPAGHRHSRIDRRIRRRGLG